jgi:hypothetical protein
VQSVLGKLALCRTAALGGHHYECPQCQHGCLVYNSCIDRHCPLCSGGRRADWLAKTAELLLPAIDYFQVVFTVPEPLWPLMLGNRRATYRLLFHAAWQALREVVREEVGCEPAALMVLHTWNQRLEHYLHLHALVPGVAPRRTASSGCAAGTPVSSAARSRTWSTTACWANASGTRLSPASRGCIAEAS